MFTSQNLNANPEGRKLPLRNKPQRHKGTVKVKFEAVTEQPAVGGMERGAAEGAEGAEFLR